MRRMTLRIKEILFVIAQYGFSLHRVIESAMKFELMHHKEHGVHLSEIFTFIIVDQFRQPYRHRGVVIHVMDLKV